MGYYVNPPDESKESFLSRNGIPISVGLKWADLPKGSLPVVLVHNGPFTAAAIAYSEAELKVFSDPSDRRQKKYFVVKVEKLLSVSDPGFANFVKNNGLI